MYNSQAYVCAILYYLKKLKTNNYYFVKHFMINTHHFQLPQSDINIILSCFVNTDELLKRKGADKFILNACFNFMYTQNASF